MFSPLQVISCYSLLQSPLKISDLVKKASEMGYQALALTDINVMYGVLDFYKACRKYHIKPLLGLTLQLNDTRQKQPANDVILLAKNNQGYHNLMKLSSLKMTKDPDDPNGDRLLLTEIAPLLHELFVITPTKNSLVLEALHSHNFTGAKTELTKIKEICDPNSLFLGVSMHMEDQLVIDLRALAKELSLNIVAASPLKYLRPEQNFEVSVLNSIRLGKKMTSSELTHQQDGLHFLKSPQEFLQEYQKSGLEDAFQNTTQIVDQVDIQIEFPPTRLPRFKTPKGYTSAQFLQELCQAGLKKRAQENQIRNLKPYQKRLDHELAVIERMGFDDYFLVVWDVTHFAHEHQIMIGPGRGSAAGSLVAYTLMITDVDPLQYNLLFERFLNEERAQMPDIDLDIPDLKRDQVIKYVHEKYGHEQMAQIITFGTLAAKQALRDVGRVMGETTYEMDQWSKAIPSVLHITLAQAYQQSQRLQNLVADSQKNELIYRTATHLEGLPRHYSLHAAGVILSEQKLSDLVPVQLGPDEMLVTQFAKDQVEEVGLLKMDFLGLRNLTILENSLRFIAIGYQQKLDIHQIDLKDPPTLALFQKADTNGVFQFESDGIRNVLRKLIPTSFEDIAAVNALYRPGPMNNIDEFIARKHGQRRVTYPDPSLKKILEPTYGIMVYQEQVMQVASAMGAFSLGQADLLRRAMSKKKHDVISEMQQKFINGATSKGFDSQTAEKVYDYISRFGDYGFNRSHAVAYSKMAFELAYVKCHYPAAFYAALLNSVIGSDKKIKTYLTEAKSRQIKVHAPAINESEIYFILKNHAIYFGLGCIKTVRRNFVHAIIQERKAHGPYRTFNNFLQRIPAEFLKQEGIEALIYSGAFDELEPSRAKLLDQLPKMLKNAELSGANVELFEMLAPKAEETVPELSEEERLNKENYYLGAFLSGHPVEKFPNLMQTYHTAKVSEIRAGQSVTTIVYVKKIKTIRTKKGEQMAFVTADDETGTIDLTVFPQQFRQYGSKLSEGVVVMVKGKVEERRGLQLLVSSLNLAQDVIKQRYFLRLPNGSSVQKKQELKRLLEVFHGKVPVIVYDEHSNRKVLLSEKLWLSTDDRAQQEVIKLLGESNVVLK